MDRCLAPAHPSPRPASAHRGIRRIPVLDGDTESIGDPIDAAVRRRLTDVVHISIAETDRSERIDIGFDHLAGRSGQLQRIGQHRRAPLTDRGGSPVDVDLGEERVVFQESAQTAPVVSESIVAVVLERNDVGDQLSLDLAQRPGPRHGRPVEAVVGGQSSGLMECTAMMWSTRPRSRSTTRPCNGSSSPSH